MGFVNGCKVLIILAKSRALQMGQKLINRCPKKGRGESEFL